MRYSCFLLALIYFFLTGCTDSPLQSSATIASDSGDSSNRSATTVPRFAGELHLLSISRDTFLLFFETNRRIIFQCIGSETSNMSLVAFKNIKRSDSTDFYSNEAKILSVEPLECLNITGQRIIWGDQKLVVADVKAIRRELRDSSKKFVVFQPDTIYNPRAGQQAYNIYYHVAATKTVEKLTPSRYPIQTNPSPPASIRPKQKE